ncbi:MAG TPA: hypothetical protein VLE53_12730 [Gemmatimonadaceae bacterium]|nr:hypothetical protein [Gemmatimonadaceae bacterium]
MRDDRSGFRTGRRGWAGAALVAALLTGCTGDGAAARGPDVVRAPAAALAGRADSPPAISINEAAPPVVTPSIRDVVSSRALVGHRVRVTGRCLGAGSEHPLGQPPRSRHEWQLEADGVAVFVIGPQPRGCRTGDGRKLTITALVAEDTLPAIGDLPPAPRRFLVFAGEAPR